MATGTDEKLRVFVSYAREDAAFAADLVAALEACRFAPFIDTEQMVGGVPFDERIARLIADADSVVAVLSPDALASQWCGKEAELAEGLGKRLIPIVCRDVATEAIPTRLRRLHYIAFTGPGRSFARGLLELAAALNADLAWVQEHSRLGQLASHWDQRGRNSALLLPASEIEAAKAWFARRPKDAPEPTLLQRELIAASEEAERDRLAREKAQAEAMQGAEVARVRAEQDALQARLEAEQVRAASARRRQWAILAALLATGIAGGGFALREIRHQQHTAEQQRKVAELEKKNAEFQRANADYQKVLAEAKVAVAVAGRADPADTAAQPPSYRGPTRPPGPAPDASPDKGATTSEPLPTAPAPTPAELQRRVSADALDLIVLYDSGGEQAYTRNEGRPVWYGLSGGVTIGIGYDLGYATLDQFRRDWGGLLEPSTMDRLATAIGVRGAAAQELAKSLADVSIPWETARTAFRTGSLPRFAELLDRALPNVAELPPDSYGALLSLVYNRGASFDRDGDRFREMRAIKEAMTKRDFAAVPAQLRGMTRIWPGMVGLQKRREAEAALFEKGLATLR